MVWNHLDIDKPHLAYMIIGGFTSLFMLCSLFVKERLYIGEATVASLCGVIFGRHAANLFDPISWGNVDKITLECSRIVLVVQCFAVGVELPKSYMERHWKSVSLLLLPVMTWGWLVTSLFIWWMIEPLSWIESLACAACVTATDPVLASSVVGKGKFAKRVPKHLRDLLSAESGCNDGMAFPFIYLSLYIIQYKNKPGEVVLHWICVTILYECILGAIVGFLIGYAGRHAIRFAEEKNLIDRESFLVFYFVLALFCAGLGSLLGMDDLLMGFAAGVGFSNDGWFTEKTEESHVSNVIDLLLNLAYFVYLGAIIPWEHYNAPQLGLVPWRLVVIAIFVLLFRRIPIMLILKPIIPDVKTWREALFAGHFGPIGVGAIFACILARAELETDSTQPLDVLPQPGEHNYTIISVIWPITTFLVISSILVHGSSIAVFTLGKRINTLTITLSYTQGNEEGPSWMNRLPRLSASRSSLSMRTDSLDKDKEFAPGTLGPIGIPRNFLRRQRDRDREEGVESDRPSRASSSKPTRRQKNGAGGPISQSAIYPERDYEATSPEGTAVTGEGLSRSPSAPPPEEGREREEAPQVEITQPEMEVYKEGQKIVLEDEEGNVFETRDVADMTPEERQDELVRQHERLQEDPNLSKSKSQPHERNEGQEMKEMVKKRVHPLHYVKRYLSPFHHREGHAETGVMRKPANMDRGRRSARAYQFGRTVIVEDEDGEVLKKYSIPAPQQAPQGDVEAEAAGNVKLHAKRGTVRMPTWGASKAGASQDAERGESSEDENIRFTIPDFNGEGGTRRLNKADFIKELQRLDTNTLREILARQDPTKTKSLFNKDGRLRHSRPHLPHGTHTKSSSNSPESQRILQGEGNLKEKPLSSSDPDSLSQPDGQGGTAEESRQRQYDGGNDLSVSTTSRRRRDSEDNGTARIPPAELRRMAGLAPSSSSKGKNKTVDAETGETPAERKRRLAALGALSSSPRESEGASESDEEDGEPRQVKGRVQFADGSRPAKKKGGAGRVVRTSRLSSLPASGPSASSASFGDVQNGSGNEEITGDDGRGKRHISWGGERGRNI
ncbi:hypothetical protein VTO42DRAFT_3134 [Malbranchea cinnamomea]